ncbi:FAD-binding protein [Paenibacillus sp. HN-1]|uniref:FAD-dependent oxidoreductase n=1 Tax=Paenibacillus TaxID=44249 RepID=UPI001CAA0009|nr:MULTISPECIES: FAD-dependent oxidoreductase [Paenibacillus]MBY9077879.1 FAD-binding protein [Paenibacillus sp. CGMCC 1.18879]MBY9088165.1 FAD-binding protein [Paenibacillus sinensis]
MRKLQAGKWKIGLLCASLILPLLAGCSGDSSEPAASAKPKASAAAAEPAASETASVPSSFKAGTYAAKAEGKDGELEVKVALDDQSKITDIQVASNETEGIGKTAIETLKKEIIDNQSLSVDAVSGASETSSAMVAAVEDALKQAGSDVGSFKSREIQKAGEGKTEKLTADVAVVGAGASGVSAAVSAADKGAKVIIIEKTATIGGASNLSWAGKFYNSSAALENGVKVNVEKEITDWIRGNHWRVDAADLRQYVTKSGETYDWLAEKGYKTTFLNFFGEQLHVLPAYETRQATLRKMLAASVEAHGGQVLTETTGKKLITDGSGAVTGVVAEKADGTVLEVSAKSVVIATGGYAGNKEMVKENFGFEGINGGLGQNIGEGLRMAWDAGARVPDNFGGQMLHQTLARATENLKKQYEPFQASYPLMLSYLPNFMNVGPSGARFRDEAATLEAVAAANTSAFNGAYHLVIVSQAQIDALTAKGMNGVKAPSLPAMPPEFYASFTDQFKLDTPWKDAGKVLDAMVANGDGYKGNTPEELAKNAGMDVAVFTEAFNSYQNAIKTGVDTEFGKDKKYLIPMGDQGPYYAIIAEINNLGSVGGLIVNTKFQVLGDKKVPVKGLYAVGLESEGVLFNDTYVGNGVGIGYSFTSGRLGGEDAATSALAQ